MLICFDLSGLSSWMTSGWFRRASWGKRILWWTNHGTCNTRGQLYLWNSLNSGFFLWTFAPLPPGGGTWRCRVWTCQLRWPSYPLSPVRRPSKSSKRMASTRPLWWMSQGECPAGHWIISRFFQSCWRHLHMCVCLCPDWSWAWWLWETCWPVFWLGKFACQTQSAKFSTNSSNMWVQT